jgi:hypothetical protein
MSSLKDRKAVLEQAAAPKTLGELTTQEHKARAKLLREIAKMYEGQKGRFQALKNVEDFKLGALRGKSTSGTPFEPVVAFLNDRGITTLPTIGSVMDVLALDQDHIDHIACGCRNPDKISSFCMGGHFRRLARYSTVQGWIGSISDSIAHLRQNFNSWTPRPI